MKGNSPHSTESGPWKGQDLCATDLRWLGSLARALLREPQAAEDLVQDTALAALRGAIPEGAPKRTWLASVARRLAARRLRGDARRNERERRAAREESLPDARELVARAEVAERLTAAARRLPEPFRRTILLRFLEGLSPEEIARRESKPVDTVRWRVRRALALLREELERSSGEDWASWSVLLLPLARSRAEVALAAAGSSSWPLAIGTAMKLSVPVLTAVCAAGLWFLWRPDPVDPSTQVAATESPGLEVPALLAGERPPQPADLSPPPLAEEREVEPAKREPPLAVLSTEVASEPRGRVVRAKGRPIEGAEIYWPRPGEVAGSEIGRTQSDREGWFRVDPSGTGSPLEADWGSFVDLGVVANGYLRKVIPGREVAAALAKDELVVELSRGKGLTGFVVDENGNGVPELDLLAYTSGAGIDHVSPTRVLQRAERAALAGSGSDYFQCRASTDGRGRVSFSGLNKEEILVRSLDPGWTIEGIEPGTGPSRGGASGVVWVARRRLGVRLLAFDTRGRPLEKAGATFRCELTFADGEVVDFGQWVGGGSNRIDFVLDPNLTPGIEARTIRRAAFYGTLSAGEASTDWAAEPISDPVEALGVAKVRVELDPLYGVARESVEEVDPGEARLDLDVRYADGAPFEGELRVRWSSRSSAGGTVSGSELAKDRGRGRYRTRVSAGRVFLGVADRWASGSLSGWEGELSCEPDSSSRVAVTLPRGAAATIRRPSSWRGEWFVRAQWRPLDAPLEARGWQGGLGYSTDERELTLSVMRPAEWRFELRRYSPLERDPIVRTAVLREGERVEVTD